LTFSGYNIHIPRLKDFVNNLNEQLHQRFFGSILASIPTDCIAIPESIGDDVDNREAGYSWLKHPKNAGWTSNYRTDYMQNCSYSDPKLLSFFYLSTSLDSDGRPHLNRGNCYQWLSYVEAFKMEFIHMMNYTSGGSARDTEIYTITFSNTNHKKRNVLFMNGDCVIVPIYNKNTSKSFRILPVPRVLAPCLARIILIHTLIVAEFESYLMDELQYLEDKYRQDGQSFAAERDSDEEQQEACSDEEQEEGQEEEGQHLATTVDKPDETPDLNYLCCGISGRWHPSRVSNHLRLITEPWFGTGIGSRAHRQILHAIVNRHMKLDPVSVAIYNEMCDFTFGHSSETSRQHYAVETHAFTTLTSDQVGTCFDASNELFSRSS
jgi:hypothetical protein